MNTEDYRKKLEGLSAALAGRDGLHEGIAGNQQAVELEIGQMLYGAMRANMPDNVVELGTGTGYAATWMLLGLIENDRGQLYTLDPLNPYPAVWNEINCPVQQLTYVNEMAQEWDNPPETIDFLFHDASHNPNQVLADIQKFAPRIPINGVVAIHDVNYARNMGDMLAQWFDQHADEWEYQEFSRGCGLGVAKRIGIKVNAKGMPEGQPANAGGGRKGDLPRNRTKTPKRRKVA